jgi:nucleotide-binding universal stress UspA family protein
MSNDQRAERTIVVGHDGSERGDDALALGALLARTVGARVVVAGVYRRDEHHYPGGAALEDEIRTMMLDSLADVSADDLGVPAELRVVPAKSPAHGLHELADAVGAELIVVGSTHRGAIGRVVPGSAGERLLQEAPCAVAIAPHSFAKRHEAHLGVVGVGYDRTIASEDAVRIGARIASAAGATLRLISVADARMGVYGEATVYTDWYRGARERTQSAVDAACDALADEVRAEAVVLEGNASEELVAASNGGLDLLVLGSRAYGPLGRALAGSVSIHVAREAGCPVLIVPRTVAERDLAVRPEPEVEQVP